MNLIIWMNWPDWGTKKRRIGLLQRDGSMYTFIVLDEWQNIKLTRPDNRYHFSWIVSLPPLPPPSYPFFCVVQLYMKTITGMNQALAYIYTTHPIVQSQTGWRGKRALQTDIIHIICYVKIADWKSSFVPPFIPFFLFIHPFISFFFFSWTFVLRVLQFVIVCGRPFVSGAICPAFQPTRFFLFFKWNASFWIRKENEHEKKRKQK